MKPFLMLLCFCLLGTMVCTAQLELRKSGSVVAADYQRNTSNHGWVSVGFVAADRVGGTSSSGWVGFYPIAQSNAVSNVFDYATSVAIWPQPATTHVYMRGIPIHSTHAEGGLPAQVVATDVYGRQTSLPMQYTESDVVRIDVDKLAVGTYVLQVGRGVIVRIGSQP